MKTYTYIDRYRGDVLWDRVWEHASLQFGVGRLFDRI